MDGMAPHKIFSRGDGLKIAIITGTVSSIADADKYGIDVWQGSVKHARVPDDTISYLTVKDVSFVPSCFLIDRMVARNWLLKMQCASV